MTQPEQINNILIGGCKYFGLTMDELQIKTGSRSIIWEKKRYLIPILDEYTVCNTDAIANYLGYKSRANVIFHRKNIREALSDEVYGETKTKRIYNELLSYLNL